MFNKKKKKWFNTKPHYKRGPNDVNPMPQNFQSGNQNDDNSIVNHAENDFNGPVSDFEDSEINSPIPEEIIFNGEASINKDQANVNSSIATKELSGNQNIAGGIFVCEICNMPIRNQYTSVHHKISGSPVHFDCVIRELSREYYSKLGRFRKIYYIGAGNFAIVKEFYDKRGHLKNYEIVEKISYEIREK